MRTDLRELTKDIIRSIGRDRDFLYRNMHRDIEIHFPFASTNGFLTNVKGIENVKPHLDGIISMLDDWQADDIEVTPFADPDMFLVRYRAVSTGRLGPYHQQYITMVRYQDSQLILFREYWDTAVFERAFGSTAEPQ